MKQVDRVFNVLDYGAVADGRTLNSEAVQRAIDACSAEGGRVLFPVGSFVLGTVFLKSDVEIYLSKGAEIVGSENFEDFERDEKVNYPLYQDASHSFFHCSMFVAENAEHIKIKGEGKIDMRSVWDTENVRDMSHRGAKCIACKECKDVEISGIEICNATDLGVYLAGCKDVSIKGLKLCVYIDGISPDNCTNVTIEDCDVESGDDGIVFKSSYTLNRLDVCDNVKVRNCRIKSQCNALKFGTETNGGFFNFDIDGLEIYETRISGIAIESVDGAIIDGIKIRNVKMKNVHAPIFIHLGDRLRGPKGTKIGKIENIFLENITAEGPYTPYRGIEWNYGRFCTKNQEYQPWKLFGKCTEEDAWQVTCNVCGQKERSLKNVTMKNVRLLLDGGVTEYERTVPEKGLEYPEVYMFGRILPAKGIYFRYVEGLVLENVAVRTYREDVREDFVFDEVVF